jgi:hypothetical protein
MSKRVICPVCGKYKDIPAFPGDGVYTRHVCEEKETTPTRNTRAKYFDEGDEPQDED